MAAIKKSGILYGVSVGPGDPELMTLQAVRRLQACPVIAAPQTKSGQMLALDIARKVVMMDNKTILPLHFPMSRDPETLQIAHGSAAEALRKHLDAGRDVAVLQSQLLDRSGTILLEDLGNLAANELYAPGADLQKTECSILDGINSLAGKCQNLVIVSNEVGIGGADYQGEVDSHLQLLGHLHQSLAKMADGVCEVVGGLPLYYKGRDHLCLR